MLANALVVAYNEMSIDVRRKEMARIILSDAVQFGIKGTTKSKPRAERNIRSWYVSQIRKLMRIVFAMRMLIRKPLLI